MPQRNRAALAALAVALVAAASLLWGSVGPHPSAQRLLPDDLSQAPVTTIDGYAIPETPGQLTHEIE
ncbi:hypothetical protein ABTM30_19595, partial [Acinetobacter baumannii]